MLRNLRKYWDDIARPILFRETPPVVPQAIVLDGDAVLLVRRDAPALWELPGGAMLPGETPEAAIVREVFEETTARVEVVARVGWFERTGFRAHRSPVYLCRRLDMAVAPGGDDVVAARFFERTRLPRAMFPWHREVIAMDVTGASPSIEMRQHLGLRVVLRCIWLDLGSRLGLYA